METPIWQRATRQFLHELVSEDDPKWRIDGVQLSIQNTVWIKSFSIVPLVTTFTIHYQLLPSVFQHSWLPGFCLL